MENFDPSKNTVDKYGKFRVDFLFSYWIIFWFLIYYFTQNIKGSPIASKIQKYMNPKLALYFGFFENFGTFLYIIWLNSKLSIIFKYLLMLLLIKVLPIYLIKEKIHLWNDIIVFIFVFLIYNIYLWINDETIYSVYERTFTSIKNNQNKTLVFWIFDKFEHMFV